MIAAAARAVPVDDVDRALTIGSGAARGGPKTERPREAERRQVRRRAPRRCGSMAARAPARQPGAEQRSDASRGPAAESSSTHVSAGRWRAEFLLLLAGRGVVFVRPAMDERRVTSARLRQAVASAGPACAGMTASGERHGMPARDVEQPVERGRSARPRRRRAARSAACGPARASASSASRRALPGVAVSHASNRDSKAPSVCGRAVQRALARARSVARLAEPCPRVAAGRAACADRLRRRRRHRRRASGCPVSPWRTTSGTPAMSCATTGKPAACASR